jgi:hypothetical protein
MQGSDKHFVNSPSTLVVDSLKGLCAQNPNVGLDVTHKGTYIPVACAYKPLCIYSRLQLSIRRILIDPKLLSYVEEVQGMNLLMRVMLVRLCFYVVQTLRAY